MIRTFPWCCSAIARFSTPHSSIRQRYIAFFRAAARPKGSKPEHMVEAERSRMAEESVIAEQPAGLVADDRVGAGTGARADRRVEQRVIANEARPRAGNSERGPGNFAPGAVMQDDVGGAGRPPRARGRV